MSIPLTYLRSSMAGTLKMCEIKFLLSYGLGHAELSNLKTDMGTMVHKVMEILAKIKLARQNNKRKIEDEIVGKYTTSPKNFDLDFIVDSVFNYYAKQFSHHVWTDKEHKTVAAWVQTTITDYNGKFDPFNQDIVEPERHFSIQLEDDWAKNVILNGTIDLLIKNDSSTYEIVDYKTGKRIDWATREVKDYKYLQNDFQLRLYHLAASILYPEIDDIFVTIYFINDGGPFTIPFSRNDLPETKENIRKIYEYIMNMEEPKAQSRFHPRDFKSPCKFCHYAKNTFEGTNVKPILNQGQIKTPFSKKGECLTMCEQTQYILNFRDIDTIVKHMSKEGYNIQRYKPPGEAE
jgi:hypothetical protein